MNSPIALLAILGLLLPLLASEARAEGREFNGLIVKVGEKRMLVKNRMGDKLRFRKTPQTAVEGKPSWKALAEGDRVIVEYVRSKEERNRATRVIVLHSGR